MIDNRFSLITDVEQLCVGCKDTIVVFPPPTCTVDNDLCHDVT